MAKKAKAEQAAPLYERAFEAYKRVCQTCCDPAECAAGLPEGTSCAIVDLPACVRRNT